MAGRIQGWTALALNGAALVLAIVALGIVLPHLRGAELWQYDEWYTSERVQGIVARGDWLTLFSNGEPVFKKPPLQYWTSALLRLGGMEEALALRLPSLVSALAVGWLTMRLAVRMAGGAPLAGLLALGLVLSSPLYWVSATSAMLDMPAALAVLAAVMATLRAWAAPRWWWAVALAVGLGALQKAPVALPAVLLAMAVLRLTDGPAARAGRHGIGAAGLAVALIAIWPATQWLISGEGALRIAFLQEQSRRFLPALMEDGARHIRWLGWVAQDGPWLWGGMGLATFALPLLRDGAAARVVLALAAIFFAALTAARGEIFDRYLVQILPFVAAAAGAALAVLASRLRRGTPAALACALTLSASAGGPLKPPSTAGLDRAGMAPFRPILHEFRAAIRPDESLIVCGWGKSDLILFPGALWQLGSGDKPFRRIWRPEELREAIAIDNIHPPLRGLCLDAEFAALKAASPAIREEEREAGFVHWSLR